MEGPGAHTVMRATQFHELPAEVIAMTRQGSQAKVFDVDVQTGAARTVGEVLVELAEGSPLGRAPDLAGPREANFADLARAFVQRYDDSITVVPDADIMAGCPATSPSAGGVRPDRRTDLPEVAHRRGCRSPRSVIAVYVGRRGRD